MRRTARTWAAAVAATALLAAGIVQAGPAAAESRAWPDSANDVGARVPNITRVRLSNTENRMFVRANFRDLSARTFGGGSRLWIDTAGAGYPEFVIASGLTDQGTDWQIFRARRWRAGGTPLNCDVSWELNARQDTLKWSTGPGCLGRYGRLRVSVEAYTRGGTTDYSPRRHRWHPYVARG